MPDGYSKVDGIRFRRPSQYRIGRDGYRQRIGTPGYEHCRERFVAASYPGPLGSSGPQLRQSPYPAKIGLASVQVSARRFGEDLFLDRTAGDQAGGVRPTAGSVSVVI